MAYGGAKGAKVKFTGLKTKSPNVRISVPRAKKKYTPRPKARSPPKPPSPPPPKSGLQDISDMAEYLEKLADVPAGCRIRRGVTICNEKIAYHEKQRLKLCGLHATNNLLQNTTVGQRLFTKEDFDAMCKRLRLLDRPYKICDDTGFYHSSVIEHCLYERGFISERIKDIDKFKVIMANIRFFLGIIALYEDDHLVRHFVTIIYKNNKYYIIDSESPEAFFVSSAENVYKYFGFDLVSAIGVYINYSK